MLSSILFNKHATGLGCSQARSGAPRLTLLLLVLAFSTPLLASCETPRSRLHGSYVPEGSLRVAEVVALATREEIVANDRIYEALIDQGIDDIQDGDIAAGRVSCCGGPNEQETAIWVYVPPDIEVAVGDIVEVRSDKVVLEGESGKGTKPNTVTRVREKSYAVNKQCRWVPENPSLWTRRLYCDWMEEEGWEEQSGLFDHWIKMP